MEREKDMDGMRNVLIKSSIGKECLVGDGAHKSLKRVENGVLYLTSKNFKGEGLDLSKRDYISDVDFDNNFKDNSKALTKPKENDILMSIIGTLGSPYLVKKIDKFGISSSVAIIRPNEKINSLFLSHYIKSDYVQNTIRNIKSGVAQSFLSLDMIRSLPLYYPPLPIQKKIASILSAYDDLIENNNKRIELLEESAMVLYKEWFVNMRFLNYEDTEFIDGLPFGWERKKADTVYNINIGKTPPRKEPQWFNENTMGKKWISIRDMREAKLYVLKTSELIIDEGVEKFNINIAPKDTVILSFKLTVGQVAITAEDMVTNEAIAHFNIKNSEEMNKEFTFLYLKNFKYDSLGSTSSIGTAINSKIVKAMPILVPEKIILKQFKSYVEPIFQQILNLQVQNNNLKEARNLLLPKFMNGEIEV